MLNMLSLGWIEDVSMANIIYDANHVNTWQHECTQKRRKKKTMTTFFFRSSNFARQVCVPILLFLAKLRAVYYNAKQKTTVLRIWLMTHHSDCMLMRTFNIHSHASATHISQALKWFSTWTATKKSFPHRFFFAFVMFAFWCFSSNLSQVRWFLLSIVGISRQVIQSPETFDISINREHEYWQWYFYGSSGFNGIFGGWNQATRMKSMSIDSRMGSNHVVIEKM